MKISVGYLVDKGVLKVTTVPAAQVQTKYHFVNSNWEYTYYGTPNVDFSGSAGEADVAGATPSSPGWGTDTPDSSRQYCDGGSVGAYDDPPTVNPNGYSYYFGYGTITSWAPTGAKAKFCMHAQEPKIVNNSWVGNELSGGNWVGLSRAQFMVYLARALNDGTDPTDTSAHDGYFTDTIDTTATWYPHFRYLQNHANIGNALLDHDGSTSSGTHTDNQLRPEMPATRFWAAHLIRYAFNIERNPDYEQFTYTWRLYSDGTPDTRTGTWSELTNRNTLGVMPPGGDVTESVLRLYSHEIAAGAPWYKCLDRVWLQGNSQLGRRSVFSPGGQCRLSNSHEKHHIVHLLARAMYWRDTNAPPPPPPMRVCSTTQTISSRFQPYPDGAWFVDVETMTTILYPSDIPADHSLHGQVGADQVVLQVQIPNGTVYKHGRVYDHITLTRYIYSGGRYAPQYLRKRIYVPSRVSMLGVNPADYFIILTPASKTGSTVTDATIDRVIRGMTYGWPGIGGAPYSLTGAHPTGYSHSHSTSASHVTASDGSWNWSASLDAYLSFSWADLETIPNRYWNTNRPGRSYHITNRMTVKTPILVGSHCPDQHEPPKCTIDPGIFGVSHPDTRTQITLENPNSQDMTINSATYTIEKTGSPDNQTNVNALAVTGNPSVIPAGGEVILYSDPQAISQTGDYSVSWNIRTSIGSDNWSTAGGEIQTAEGSPCESNLRIAALPPVCTIEAAAFGLDGSARIEITLENLNGADITIDSAEYTIQRPTSPDNQLDVDALAVSGNPSVIPAGGQAVLYSDPRTMSQDGSYSVSWAIATSLSGQSWSTAGGEIQTADGAACESSLKIAWRPFIKVFYGGLAAGGQFGSRPELEACGEGFAGALGGERSVEAFIAGHMEGSGPSDARGSSAEYSLQAYDVIGGFYSASQRSSDPIPIKGLTLANGNGSGTFGGNWQRKTCLANWWRNAERIEETTKPSPLEVDLGDLNPNDRRRYELSSGETLELQAAAPLGGLKATLYVKGDVLITSDIDNEAAMPWHDPSEIGILAIIVEGNIDIAPSVSRIDALLVAYPRIDSFGDLSDGRIRTCWDPVLTDPLSPADIHLQTCNRQLVINGALAAEKILFGRVHASVRQETDFPATPSTTRASEIINLLPEYLVGVPELPFFPDQVHKTESMAPKASNF